MKRIVALVLIVTYMASAIGFSYSLHYCGGHYKYVCFTSDTEKGCCGKNEHKSNCCKDKVIKAKFKSNHNPVAKAVLGKVFFECTTVHQLAISSSNYAADGYRTYISSDPSPPGSSDCPIYLLNRVLRI